jgi:hypothetical protein
VSRAVLWILLFVAIVGLVVVQVASMRAARRVAGGSSRGVITLRVLNLVALLGLAGWILYSQFAR